MDTKWIKNLRRFEDKIDLMDANFCTSDPKSLKLNKAGLKMHDIIKEFPEIAQCKTYLDLCGGPGGWSKLIIELGLSGYGITLISSLPSSFVIIG